MAKRLENNRPTNAAIPTIIGAGITEQYYFTHLRDLLGLRMKIRPRFFGREDVKSIQKKIEEVLAGNGIAICVFDADVTVWDKTEKKRFDALLQKYYKNKSVIICDSMPSIEYWFLLHYENVNRQFGNSKAVERLLKRHITAYEKTADFLQKPKWVAEMSANNKIDKALKSANKTTHEDSAAPYTNVPKAIDLLRNKH